MIESKVSPWLHEDNERAVVLSSRIRLARNLSGVPFPHVLKDKNALKETIQKLSELLNEYDLYEMDNLTREEKALLVEKHLISPLFIKTGQAVLINEDESVSIMIHEEDHIRIQAMTRDVSFKDLYDKAVTVDEVIEEQLHYAFDETYGYLTACPTNVGTGMRASVMLHLPALTVSRKLNAILENLSRFGYTLRGIYGEGSASIGHVYQLSNQMTFGQTEEEIVDNLNALKETIVNEEIKLRQMSLEKYPVETTDTIFRSYGLLKHARFLSINEASKALSDIKVGVDLGLITIPEFNFQVWMQLIQYTFLKTLIDDEVDSYEALNFKINVERANLMREKLGG